MVWFNIIFYSKTKFSKNKKINFKKSSINYKYSLSNTKILVYSNIFPISLLRLSISKKYDSNPDNSVLQNSRSRSSELKIFFQMLKKILSQIYTMFP